MKKNIGLIIVTVIVYILAIILVVNSCVKHEAEKTLKTQPTQQKQHNEEPDELTSSTWECKDEEINIIEKPGDVLESVYDLDFSEAHGIADVYATVILYHDNIEGDVVGGYEVYTEEAFDYYNNKNDYKLNDGATPILVKEGMVEVFIIRINEEDIKTHQFKLYLMLSLNASENWMGVSVSIEVFFDGYIIETEDL